MKKNIFWISLFATLFLTYACNKKEKSPDSSQNPAATLMNGVLLPNQNPFFVSQDKIMGIAEKYTEATFNQGIVDMTTKRAINNAYPVLDKKGSPAFYVVNYAEKKGSIIFSADFRFEPIIYFNTNGNLKSTEDIPNSFRNILNVYMKKIEALRYDVPNIEINNYMTQYNAGMQGWAYLDNLFEKCCLHPSDNVQLPGWDPCANFNYPPPYVITPLITTRWDQGDPYNRMLQPLSNVNCYMQLPWVGCVAIAVGQVVRYTQPTTIYNYDYSQMPDEVLPFNPPGEVERLLQRAHNATAQVTTCAYTSSTTVSARQTLSNTFNIQSAKRDGTINSNSNTVKAKMIQQLENGWPMILGGTTGTDGAVSFPSFAQAHSWVCDGYRHERYCTYTTSYFHMNWGWGGDVEAGWCLWNNWTPIGETDEYDLFLSMVYDIHN